jgi:hypothetical protein
MYIAENPRNLNVKDITIYIVSMGRFETSWTIAVAAFSAILSSHGEGGIAGAFLGTGAGGTTAIPALTGLTGNRVAAQSQTTFHESEHATLMNLNSAYNGIIPHYFKPTNIKTLSTLLCASKASTQIAKRTSRQVRSTERGHHSAAPANQKLDRLATLALPECDRTYKQCVPEVTRHIFVQPRVPVAPAQPRSNKKIQTLHDSSTSNKEPPLTSSLNRSLL